MRAQLPSSPLRVERASPTPVHVQIAAWLRGAVSRVTSGGLGYSLGVSIAFAYLPVGLAEDGTRLEVGIFGEQVGATVRTDPLYDPASARVRA